MSMYINMREKMFDTLIGFGDVQIGGFDDFINDVSRLKSLQLRMKDYQRYMEDIKIEQDSTSLMLIRKYIMQESLGKDYFRRLVRKYYPLEDDRIIQYETSKINGNLYKITNVSVLNRKGNDFVLDSRRYRTSYRVKDMYLFDNIDLAKEIDPKSNMCKAVCGNNRHVKYEDISVEKKLSINDDNISKYEADYLKNPFVDWKSDFDIRPSCYRQLLDNKGYIAQQGVEDIESTIRLMQERSNAEISNEIAQVYIDKYQKNQYELYSYLPLKESFIITNKDYLNWKVLDENPYLEWTFPLIRILLLKFDEMPEPFKINSPTGNSSLYNKLLAPILNKEVLLDIEKLYGL